MSSFSAKLKARKEIAESTMAFYLERPTDFNFKAGQFFEVTLRNPPETDAEGNSRTFSIASAPFEEDLMLATRMRDSAFKRVMKTLPIGAQLDAEGPYGSFVLHDDASRPAVFLVGGIGITPVRSIVMQAAKDKLPHKLYLFYANRRPEDAAFLEELQRIERSNPNYKLIGAMTQMENSRRPWHGETGYIDRRMIAKFIDDFTASIYYTVGPPEMVRATRKLLEQIDVTGDSIRVEDFVGY